MDYFTDLTLVENKLRNKADLLKIPIAGSFELTPLCNMDCKMCYVRMSKSELKATGGKLHTADEWIQLGKQAVKEGLMFLLLTGGEPFLYPDFVKVYHTLRNMGLVIMINTNGTMLTEEILEELKTNKPRRVNISLYGSSNEVYKNLCNNPNGFTQVMSTVGKLQSYGIDVRFNMALTPWNKDDFPKMLSIAREKNIPTSIANYIFPANRRNMTSEQAASHRFSPELVAQYDTEILKQRLSSKELINHAKSKIQSSVLGFTNLDDQPSGFWCRGGTSSFWITWEHKLTPCGMVQQPNCSIEKQNFRKAWSELQEKLNKIMLSSECYNCKKRTVCQTCAASMYTETGDYVHKPEYHCRLTEAQILECKKIILEHEND